MIKATRLAALLIAIGIALTAAFFFLQSPGSGGGPGGLLGDFMECLPSDLTDAQLDEIESILLRYEATVLEGRVRPQDGAELTREFQRHVDAGGIDRTDLNQLMAKVSFYMYRENPELSPPDGSGMHPLLEEEASDSTRR
ncbi:MAG: hypothetical protein V3V49_06740 [Candidatus Krumholzibacteria bacterium]